ncbi:hypothetical protein AJ78_02314 [Emergomyces pasteurianus Ep9510]|uniref:Myb-like domain-containing protein n=1 Tax=Emergomyces pasteurianus Ep9510 TaxID=1447872 RepID=A0A1J9QN65_9EURO|nr:hypothetical protein AJ78_02314 [Emergomyces pasteurianus Ep9510]
MPSYTDGRGGLRLSFADVFKSSRTIREEMAAASYKKATVAARGKKAAAGLAAHTAKAGGYPIGFRNGSPPGLPHGCPPLVYVPVPSKTTNQANGNHYPSQCQTIPQTPAGQGQTNQPGNCSGSCGAHTNNTCTCSSTNNPPSTTPQPQQQEWTTDDDDMLRRLKAEDMTWKAISTSMGRPVQSLKTRWGIIRPAVEYKIPRPHTSAQCETGSKSQQQQQQAETHRRHERRVSFSEPLVMNGKTNPTTYTRTAKKKILYVDENFSLEEILLLNKLAAQYEDEKWLRISSRFYDKTGKRLTPQEAREHVQRE